MNQAPPARMFKLGTAQPLDVRPSWIYTHVLNKGGRGVKSPLEP